MNKTMEQTFTEVYDIICHLDKNLYDKISKEFIELIKNNRDELYEVNIDYSKDINEQELLKETRIILSLIYRDYLCSKEERLELLKLDQMEIERYEKQLQNKYDIDKIFNNRNKIKSTIGNNNEEKLIVYKKSFFDKLKDYFIKIFRKNHCK